MSEPTDARVVSLRKVIEDLLAILKRDGGFRTPKQQATIRGARALLVEVGGVVNREDL